MQDGITMKLNVAIIAQKNGNIL